MEKEGTANKINTSNNSEGSNVWEGIIGEESKEEFVVGESSSIVDKEQEFENYELNVFLYTIFQSKLEQAKKLSDKLAEDEKKPFANKYLAREIYYELKKEEYLQLPDPKNELGREETQKYLLAFCANGLLDYFLGGNYFDCEEYHNSEEYFLLSLKEMEELPECIKGRYMMYVQDMYNTLGIIYANWEKQEKGFAYLRKAEELYSIVETMEAIKINNDLNSHLIKSTSANEIPRKESFGFYIDGGVDKETLEKNYTLTMFYLAQVYAKLGEKEKGASYCAITLRRQLETKQYLLKEWTKNALAISDYFIENHHFCQTEYILFAVMAILPNSPLKRKKLRAQAHIQLGRYYSSRLKFAVTHFINNTGISQLPDLQLRVNREYVTFPSLNLNWPKVEDLKDLEEAKVLFRLSNTQYKKALEIFVLDGYVTDHVNIKRQMCQLYSILAQIEPDPTRLYAMLDRKRELLEEISLQLNTKAFLVLLQEMWNDIASTYTEMFNLKCTEAIEKNRLSKNSVISAVNKLAFKSIEFYDRLIELLHTFQDKDQDYYRAILGYHFASANLHSKMIPIKNPERELAKMKNALKHYIKVQEYTLILEKDFGGSSELKEQSRLCEEMLQLLPLKIDKINHTRILELQKKKIMAKQAQASNQPLEQNIIDPPPPTQEIITHEINQDEIPHSQIKELN